MPNDISQFCYFLYFKMYLKKVGTFANGIRKSFNNSGACSGFDLTWGVHGSSFHKPALKSLPLAFSKWSKSEKNVALLL